MIRECAKNIKKQEINDVAWPIVPHVKTYQNVENLYQRNDLKNESHIKNTVNQPTCMLLHGISN